MDRQKVTIEISAVAIGQIAAAVGLMEANRMDCTVLRDFKNKALKELDKPEPVAQWKGTGKRIGPTARTIHENYLNGNISDAVETLKQLSRIQLMQVAADWIDNEPQPLHKTLSKLLRKALGE